EREFEDIALAHALQFLYFIMIPRDQAALHAQIAKGALQLALGGLEVCFRSSDVAFRPADLRGHLTEFRGRIRLHLSDFLPSPLIVLLLLLLEGLRQAARAREFILRESQFLRGYIEFALQVRDARI